MNNTTRKMNTKNMVITALLIAFGIIIPIAFEPLKFTTPFGFTATLTAHVPIFVAMFISPMSAVFTAIGTTIGFFMTCPLVVTVRAASHLFFVIPGAYMLKKRMNIITVGAVTAVIHAICEALVVYIFLSLGLMNSNESYFKAAFYVTGVGTLLHHVADYIIAVLLVKTLKKAKAL